MFGTLTIVDKNCTYSMQAGVIWDTKIVYLNKIL